MTSEKLWELAPGVRLYCLEPNDLLLQLRQRLPSSHLYFRKVSIGLFLQDNYKFQEIKFVLSQRFIAVHYISLKTWDQSCLMNVTF